MKAEEKSFPVVSAVLFKAVLANDGIWKCGASQKAEKSVGSFKEYMLSYSRIPIIT